SRDGAKVEALLVELKRQSSTTTTAVNGGAQRPALRVGNDPSRNAFVQWVETRWLPAVKEWEELIRNAKKQIESDGDATATGSSGGPAQQQPQQQREHMLSTPAAAAMSRNAAKIATAADRAIASVHRDIVSRSASLKEILRPGETVEQLLHGSVEADLRALAKQKIAQRDALDALRTAVEKVQFVQLASCLREAEPFLPYLPNPSTDRSLIAEAQSLLVDVQRVAKTTVGISLASKSRDTMMLLRAIHQANETMSHLRIYSDEATMKRALKHGADHTAASPQTNAVVGTQGSAATIPNVLRAEGSRLLRVEHVPSKAWAPELSVMYQQACELLDELLLVQKLEQQLQVLMTQQHSENGGDDDGSGGNNNSEELKRVVEQCRQFGVHGPLLSAAEQLVASSNALRVKVHFDSRIRLVVIDGDQISNFSVVHHRIASVCPNSTPSSIGSPPSSVLRIRYQDDDGDYVSLLDQADWDALLSELSAHFTRQQRNRNNSAATQPPASSDAPQLGSSGKQQRRVEVYCDYPLLPAVQSPSSFGSPMGQQQQQAKPSTPLQNNKAQNAPGRLGALTPATPASSDTTKLQVAGVGMSGSGNGPRVAVVNASPLVRAAGSTPPSEPSTPPVPPPPNGPSPRRTSHPEQQQQQVPPDRRAATSEPKTATATIRVGVENVSRWEAAAAEALELLTIASQDTSASARTSLARDVSQALGRGGRSSQSPLPQPQQQQQQQMGVGIQVANRGLIRPGDVGRWADASEVDTTDIQTIASIETSRPNPMAMRPVSSPQLKSPNSVFFLEVYCDYPLLPAVQKKKCGMSGSGNGPRPAVVNASPVVRAAGSTPPSEPSTPPVPPPPNGPSPRRTSHPEQQQQQVPPDRRAATSEPKTATSTIRVGVENVSRWEAAAAEALELLTIASQDTSASARTSLARDVSQALGGGRSSQSPPPQPQQIGIQVANRGLIRPGDVGRWADASDVDTTDIQTIASIETSRPNPMARPVSSPQLKSPNSAGIPTTGSMPPPAASSSNANHREKSVMMLAQLRKQKQALESASKASQQQSHRQEHDGATKK
ncbi:Hypothetical protein, putative, partial [Bodo saltans]